MCLIANALDIITLMAYRRLFFHKVIGIGLSLKEGFDIVARESMTPARDIHATVSPMPRGEQAARPSRAGRHYITRQEGTSRRQRRLSISPPRRHFVLRAASQTPRHALDDDIISPSAPATCYFDIFDDQIISRPAFFTTKA